MMTHDKPKNDALFSTRFEQSRLEKVYHAIGWERAVCLEVNLPPVDCLAHLQALKPQPRQIHTIDWQGVDNDHYNVTITSQDRKHSSDTAVASAVITATHGLDDTDHSVIVIRSYPRFGQIAFIGFWLLILATLIFHPGPTQKDVFIGLMSGLLLLISWVLRFSQRDRLLTLMINHFAPLHDESTSKPKNDVPLTPQFAYETL